MSPRVDAHVKDCADPVALVAFCAAIPTMTTLSAAVQREGIPTCTGKRSGCVMSQLGVVTVAVFVLTYTAYSTYWSYSAHPVRGPPRSVSPTRGVNADTDTPTDRR